MACLISTDAISESAVTSTPMLQSEHHQSSLVLNRHLPIRGEDYGLNDADLNQYQVLMQGPYGRWYRDLDPTWVLGFAAQSEEERVRYAAIVVEMEHARVERELAFQRTYDRLWRSRSDESPIIDPERWRNVSDVQSMISSARKKNVAMVKSERLALFVESGCEECDVSPLLAKAQGRPVDIYVSGTSSDDDVRDWAMSQGISAVKVRQRSITLNHDEGLFDAKLDANEKMVLFVKTAKGFERWE